MPKINRRGFFRFLGAAGVTALMPVLPARVAMAGGGASASQALWASLYANSGSATKFVGVAKGMGLSGAAIQGVGTRSIGVRIAVATGANQLIRPDATHSPVSGQDGGRVARSLRDAIKKALSNEIEDPAQRPDAEPRPPDTLTEDQG